ncbi:tyrosine-protein phosphatase [Ulvibacterium sp.]|uniref:tyrosine-protein phosphatase n=1 Tax=Ulvibacterium sp. TaxID=2665914 RepID=UPI003CC661D8
MRGLFSMLAILAISIRPMAAQQDDFHKVESKYFKNLYRINDSIYRSEQPSRKGFRELEAIGVKTIINLRRLKEDDKKAKGTDLQLKKIPLRAAKMVEADINNVLYTIQISEKPALIHCWHGSDRTGVIIAAYRVVFENWEKERAIREFKRNEFGYHERWYPNLLELILNLEEDGIRGKLGI